MIQLFTTFRFAALRAALLVSISMALSACLGGTVAQQIARSIATGVADSAVANSMDVPEPDRHNSKTSSLKTLAAQQKTAAQQSPATQQSLATQQNTALQGNTHFQQAGNAMHNPALAQNILPQNVTPQITPPDPYTLAFFNARFQEIKAIPEPLPDNPPEAEIPITAIQSNQLVAVELFNVLIGEEKAAVYSKAQLLGATSLPKQREWKLWRVATGIIKTDANTATKTHPPAAEQLNENQPQNAQIITFLIPPEFGKLASGSLALVEIASPGELNIARYKIH